MWRLDCLWFNVTNLRVEQAAPTDLQGKIVRKNPESIMFQRSLPVFTLHTFLMKNS